MAGIYIHVPFCKTRCTYCDFYSDTRSEYKSRFIGALCRELEMRCEYLGREAVETVYFGGGTPSQLEAKDFETIFTALRRHFDLSNCEEITLEANPDDLTPDYLNRLSKQPFNRLSIGIQTFDDDTLRLLNRRHTAHTAIEAVRRSREAGFRNIGIDLIYGLPGETETQWMTDLQQAVALKPEHISAYHLTYEQGTVLHRMLQKRQVNEVSEETSLHFFTLLTERLQAAGYEHYEISNFCLPGRRSRHNSAYWKGVHYLGCGPSAHSFDGETREWNTASLEAYIQGMENGKRSFETERLDHFTRYNEFIITTLRTAEGIPLRELERRFGEKLSAYCRQMSERHRMAGRLKEENGRLVLTREGIFLSDGIMSDLLRVEEPEEES